MRKKINPPSIILGGGGCIIPYTKCYSHYNDLLRYVNVSFVNIVILYTCDVFSEKKYCCLQRLSDSRF